MLVKSSSDNRPVPRIYVELNELRDKTEVMSGAKKTGNTSCQQAYDEKAEYY